LKAFVEAIAYYKTHRKESIAILQKYLKSDDMDAPEETYESTGVMLIPEKPYPTLKGIQIMLHELSAREPKAKTAKPEQFVETSFVQELDTSGFIERLYKPSTAVANRDKSTSIVPIVKAKTPALEEKMSISLKSPPPPEKGIKQASVPKTEQLPSDQPDGGAQYTIKAGDSLSKLAQQFYGASWKWGKIYEANKDTVKNPHYIYIGQSITISAA